MANLFQITPQEIQFISTDPEPGARAEGEQPGAAPKILSMRELDMVGPGDPVTAGVIIGRTLIR